MTKQVGQVTLAVENLEDRCVPTVSTILSNFNGTAIPAGDTVWFSSVFKMSGLASGATANLYVTHQTISLGGTTYQLPDSHITLSPDASALASTSFENNTWDTSLPTSFGGNAFLGGFALPTPSGLPGGLNPVSWSGDFSSDTPGLKVNWQWGASVYTTFSPDYTALGVKPVDSNQLSAYKNSDHAGTPEAFKTDVTGGARGGGGSNFTGSYSATASVAPWPYVPPTSTSTLAGTVFDTSNGGAVPFAGILVTLTGTDANGNPVTLTTTTALDGTFSFTGLAAGTYSVSITPPAGYSDTGDVPGTVNGSSDGTYEGPGSFTIGAIDLGSGQNGVNYIFGLGIQQG
jgi:hypothetical protein